MDPSRSFVSKGRNPVPQNPANQSRGGGPLDQGDSLYLGRQSYQGNHPVQYVEVDRPIMVEKIIEKPVIKQVVIENPVVQEVIREVVVETPVHVRVEQLIYIQSEAKVDVHSSCKQMIAEIYGQLGCLLMENVRLRAEIQDLEDEMPLDVDQDSADILPKRDARRFPLGF